MIVLDTSVLVYAVGAPHPLRAPCQQILRALADETLRATTTLEVVQEFTHVRSRRRPRADAVALAHDYAAALSPLLLVDEASLHRGRISTRTMPGSGPSAPSSPPRPSRPGPRPW